MKLWLTFFLLILVFVTSVTPCCAEDDCSGGEEITAAKHQDIPADEGCSPFFACAGCPGFVMADQQEGFASPDLTVNEILVMDSVSPLPHFTSVPWQPPRFAHA